MGMSIVRVRASSLEFCPDEPEVEYRITAIGKDQKIERIESNMPEWVHAIIENIARNEEGCLSPSMYYPDPNTMLNFIACIQYNWRTCSKEPIIECEGDIGTIPYEKGKIY